MIARYALSLAAYEITVTLQDDSAFSSVARGALGVPS